jgi:hypothetical protein
MLKEGGYRSSADVVWVSRDNRVERRLYEDSGTASLFSNALSSSSFVNDEKYPREAINDKSQDPQKLVLGSEFGLDSSGARLWLEELALWGISKSSVPRNFAPGCLLSSRY